MRLEIAFNDRVVDLIDENWDLSIRVGAPPERRPTAKVRAMIDYLVEAFETGAPWEA